MSCIGRQILNHWTTREVPSSILYGEFKEKLDSRKSHGTGLGEEKPSLYGLGPNASSFCVSGGESDPRGPKAGQHRVGRQGEIRGCTGKE